MLQLFSLSIHKIMITPTVWVLIAQLADHCSADAEAMGSNLLKATIFSWVNLQEYNCLIATTTAMIIIIITLAN